MFDGNMYALASLLVGAATVGVLAFYLIPKQFFEVLRPKDWLTNLRWQILILLVLITLMALPSLVYVTMRYLGIESEPLRNVATVTSRVAFFGLVYVLILVFNYKRRD